MLTFNELLSELMSKVILFYKSAIIYYYGENYFSIDFILYKNYRKKGKL